MKTSLPHPAKPGEHEDKHLNNFCKPKEKHIPKYYDKFKVLTKHPKNVEDELAETPNRTVLPAGRYSFTE